MTTPLFLYGSFTASKTGKTGLTVTVDIDAFELATGTRTAIVTGGSATEARNGIYFYRIAAADPATYDYTATFKTADSTVDAQHVSAWRGSLEHLIAAVIDATLDAAISTRLAAASYTTPPTADAITDAVLDELLSGHTIAGSVAAAISAAGGAADPMTNTPADYAPGTLGARLALIGAGLVRAISNVSERGDRLTLDAGDSYTGNRALEWLDAGDWYQLSADHTAKLIVDQRLSAAATIHDPGGANQRITCELSRTQTAALEAGSAISFAVKCYLEDGGALTEEISIVRGTATIRAIVAEPIA